LTAIGQNFAAHAATITPVNDLAPWRLFTSPGAPFYGGSPLSLQLRVEITNSGNLAAPAGPAVVRFYKGDPAQGGSQIGADQVVHLAGCGDSARASVTWNGVRAGAHAVFVVVDAGNSIAESREDNNSREFTVFVGTQQAFIPRIAR
jgi:hypothetical protein